MADHFDGHKQAGSNTVASDEFFSSSKFRPCVVHEQALLCQQVHKVFDAQVPFPIYDRSADKEAHWIVNPDIPHTRCIVCKGSLGQGIISPVGTSDPIGSVMSAVPSQDLHV